MTDRELQDFIEHGETGFVPFALVFGEGWAKQAIEIAKELRARLAQPEPEPVAWRFRINNDMYQKDKWHLRLHKVTDPDAEVQPLYTAPPQREWQGLTENDFGIWREPAIGILRWAEAVLKERNK